MVGNGELTVLMYNVNGAIIQPGEGPLLSIPTEMRGDVNGKTGLQLNGVIMVGPDARQIPVSIVTGINDLNSQVPADFVVYQNYPNPFNNETVIKYGLPRPTKIGIKIYNPLGQVVRELVSGTVPAGYYTVTWNRKDDLASTVPPGVYICQFEAEGNLVGKLKMILFK
jgi:hypothetical protein